MGAVRATHRLTGRTQVFSPVPYNAVFRFVCCSHMLKGNLPSTRTINLQAALFLAWSYTLYRIMLAPSLKSVPGSWPTNITLQKDQHSAGQVFHYILKWSGKGSKRKEPRTQVIYQQYLSQLVGPRSPVRSVFQGRRPSVWIEGIWSLEDQYLE